MQAVCVRGLWGQQKPILLKTRVQHVVCDEEEWQGIPTTALMKHTVTANHISENYSLKSSDFMNDVDVTLKEM